MFEKGMVVGLKAKIGKKKERVFWGNVRSVNVCCGAPVVGHCDREYMKIFLSLSNEDSVNDAVLLLIGPMTQPELAKWLEDFGRDV